MKKFKITLEELKEVFRINLPIGVEIKQEGKIMYVTVIKELAEALSGEERNRIAYVIASKFRDERIDLCENAITVPEGFSCDIMPRKDCRYNQWAFFAPVKETVQPINKTQEDIIETIFNQIQHG